MQPLSFPDAGVLNGRDGVVAWFTGLIEDAGDFRLELEELIDAGNGAIVVRSVARGRGRTSGITSEARMTELYEIRGGLIVRAREFPDSGTALEAARQAA